MPKRVIRSTVAKTTNLRTFLVIPCNIRFIRKWFHLRNLGGYDKDESFLSLLLDEHMERHGHANHKNCECSAGRNNLQALLEDYQAVAIDGKKEELSKILKNVHFIGEDYPTCDQDDLPYPNAIKCEPADEQYDSILEPTIKLEIEDEVLDIDDTPELPFEEHFDLRMKEREIEQIVAKTYRKILPKPSLVVNNQPADSLALCDTASGSSVTMNQIGGGKVSTIHVQGKDHQYSVSGNTGTDIKMAPAEGLPDAKQSVKLRVLKMKLDSKDGYCLPTNTEIKNSFRTYSRQKPLSEEPRWEGDPTAGWDNEPRSVSDMYQISDAAREAKVNLKVSEFDGTLKIYDDYEDLDEEGTRKILRKNITPEQADALRFMYTNCPYCDRQFVRGPKYDAHLEGHIKRTFTCQQCGAVVKGLDNFKEHLENHRFSAPLGCSYCLSRFHYKANLEHHEAVHIKLHHPMIEGTGVPVAKKAARLKGADLKSSTMVCYICAKDVQRYAYTEHIERHSLSEDDKLECHLCGKKYTTTSSLKSHISSVHEQGRAFVCDVCGKDFKLQATLKRHKLIHVGEVDKPYKCSHCDKRFSTAKYLEQHENVHTGARKYKCGFCSKVFVQAAALTQHKRLHTGFKVTDEFKRKVAQREKLLRRQKEYAGQSTEAIAASLREKVWKNKTRRNAKVVVKEPAAATQV